ncbi:unnamed protein product [Mytilus edulis]|uniref:Integrase core domain-containing protein n=1 Tax=Mytilus edulis TaxID=6550 RepID=A0A8S3U986_MYTED|nr:unnamed protein product [Mytilus edulis]
MIEMMKIFSDPTIMYATFFDVSMILPTGKAEEGVGEGIFRDCLTEFWNEFMDNCCIGNSQKVPTIRHDFQEEQWLSIGRIIFKGWQIANYLPIGLSIIVMENAMFYGLSTTEQYNSICDDDLYQLLQPIIEENPHIGYRGYRSIQARLKVCGHFCQETRVREALVRLDPAAVAMRWYGVLVVHGGIDGISRLIVFLSISTNNKSAIVLQSFLPAFQKYGLPTRVRTDHGTENVDVATFMTLQKGSYRGSILQGKSVHNQRIERFWLDMYRGCTNVYYDLFTFMEREGILDMESEIHLWSLHYVFMPRIQISLDTFK